MDVMLDLETLGTLPGSVILSIGAVAFDPEAGGIGDSFYRPIRIASCQDAGLKIDGDTLGWWLDQKPETLRAALADPVHLNVAIADFLLFWKQVGAIRVWCHGASFDEPILRYAMHAASRAKVPWDFHNVRDTRTIFALTGVSIERDPSRTHHHAGDDAYAQALAVIKAWRILKPAPGEAA